MQRVSDELRRPAFLVCTCLGAVAAAASAALYARTRRLYIAATQGAAS
jgi:hypothetical protein